MTTRNPNDSVFVCAAGGHHYDLPHKVRAWRERSRAALGEEANAKIKAHDDYMEGMRLFRERIPLFPANPLGEGEFEKGYRQAIRDMDQALVDAMRGRIDEEVDR